MPDRPTWRPAWYPDPTGRHDHRWWDGAEWTGHVADAGVAGHDPLDGSAPPLTPGAGPARTSSGATGPTTADPVAVIALIVAIVAIVLAFLPGFGLVPAAAAVVLGVVARSRIRRSGRGGDGLAVAGLVTGVVALVIAVLVTTFAVALLGGSGGELAGAFREYVACLEVRSEAECRVLLEESLARIAG